MSVDFDPREDRLPKWASRRLDSLRRRVRDLEISLEERKPGPEIRVVTQPYAEHPKPVGGENAIVRFYLDRLDGYRYVDVRLDGEALYVAGSSGLVYRPGASNTVHLSTIR